MRSRWAWTHRYGLPLFVTALVAAVLLGATLIVVLLTGGDGTEPDPTGRGGFDRSASPSVGAGSPAGTPGEAPGDGPVDEPGDDQAVDSCVVGRWRVTESTQGSTVGTVFTQEGTGPVFEFGVDGTGHADYDPGVTYGTEVLGQRSTMEVTGRLDYVYVAREGRLRFTETESAAQVRIGGLIEEQYDLATTPVDYTCEGDTLELSDPDRDFAATYRRLD